MFSPPLNPVHNSNNVEATLSNATMSNEFCVEISSFRQSQTLLRHCCPKRQHCRSNRQQSCLQQSCLLLRQCCFDIVASVDRALDWLFFFTRMFTMIPGNSRTKVKVISQRACECWLLLVVIYFMSVIMISYYRWYDVSISFINSAKYVCFWCYFRLYVHSIPLLLTTHLVLWWACLLSVAGLLVSLPRQCEFLSFCQINH